MKVKQVLVPVAIASMTRSKVSLVQHSRSLKKEIEKPLLVAVPEVSTVKPVRAVKAATVVKSEKSNPNEVKANVIKSSKSSKAIDIQEIDTKANKKGWDLSTVCQECMYFSCASDFESWLSAHHTTEPAVWIKFAKKKSGIPSVTYNEALMVALCYGWIDGIRKSLDETYFLQRYTPRKSKSNWSLVNKNYVAELMASGKMQDSGLKVVNEAKADGRWDKNN